MQIRPGAFMKRKIAQKPFESYYVYGPIWHKTIGRNMICLVPIGDGKRTSMSYARYLMSTHLGRLLDRKEQVDHINGDKGDDRIENLQIMSVKENNRKALKEQGRTRMMAKLKCPVCQKIFHREYNKTHAYGRNNATVTTCSRQCGARVASIDVNDEGNVIEVYRK